MGWRGHKVRGAGTHSQTNRGLSLFLFPLLVFCDLACTLPVPWRVGGHWAWEGETAKTTRHAQFISFLANRGPSRRPARHMQAH